MEGTTPSVPCSTNCFSNSSVPWTGRWGSPRKSVRRWVGCGGLEVGVVRRGGVMGIGGKNWRLNKGRRRVNLERHCHFKGLFIFPDPSYSPETLGVGSRSCPLALGAPQDHEGLRSLAWGKVGLCPRRCGQNNVLFIEDSNCGLPSPSNLWLRPAGHTARCWLSSRPRPDHHTQTQYSGVRGCQASRKTTCHRGMGLAAIISPKTMGSK